MILNEDVVSNFKGFIYAKKGTEVKLISRVLHVSIVEVIATGERFSCKTSQLNETTNQNEIQAVPNKPIEVQKVESKQTTNKISKSAANPQQKTLF